MTDRTMGIASGFTGPNNWPCCGVSAVATACEVPFATVFDYIRQKKNADGKWKGTTHLEDRLDALTHFGAHFTHDRTKRKWNKLRLWQWALLNAKPDTTYIIDIPGHSFIFRNQHVVDQEYKSPTYFPLAPRFGNSSISNIVEITSVPTQAERASTLVNSANDLANMF